MPEIETETDLSLVLPEDLRMNKDEILADAQVLANAVVKGLPNDVSPAIERVLVKNSMDAYRMTADLLYTMLISKRSSLH